MTNTIPKARPKTKPRISAAEKRYNEAKAHLITSGLDPESITEIPVMEALVKASGFNPKTK